MMLITKPLTANVSPATFSGRVKTRALSELRNFFRRRLRKKALAVLPIYESSAQGSTLHMLVCERDHEMAIITAAMFNFWTGRGNRFVFHDDGTINREISEKFAHYLPGTKMVLRREADARAAEQLKEFPGILNYRRNQIMAFKLIDVKLWGEGERFGYIDSDVLFFGFPAAFVEALESQRGANYFNRDLADAYVADRLTIAEATGFPPASRVNAGLWAMNRADIAFSKIEAWLNHPFFAPFQADYRLDQTFISMLANASQAGADHLPPQYDVAFGKGVTQNVCKHYVGRIRHGYELEGLRYLLDSGSIGANSRQ